MFGAIFTEFGDRKYLEQKIHACLAARKSALADCEPHVKHLASTIRARRLDLPTADAKAVMAGLSKEQTKEVRDKIATMTRHMKREYPLVKAEKLVRNEFTFLTEEFGDHKKGTPVLIRKTDKSTMVIFYDHLQFAKGTIKFRKPTAAIARNVKFKAPARVPRLGGAESLIIDFFGSLLKEIGKKTGAKIFDAIFPDETDKIKDLLEDLKKDIQRIFREELDAKTITDVNAQISGVVTFMQNTYLPAKAEGRDQGYLETMLIQQHSDMTTHLMSILVDPRYRGTGIAFLVTGANAHLAIIQELALVVPKDGDPSQSHYMTTFKKTLHGYIDALTKARLDVYNKRMTYLNAVEESTLQGAATDHWWFRDTWANYQSPDFYNSHDCCDYTMDARGKAEAARDTYMKAPFIPTIIADLKGYQDTIDGWTALEKTLG